MNNLTFTQALQFLFDHIPPSDTYKYPGEKGLERQKALLVELGDPQNKLKVIHVAGTSGKGSTCYLISKILTEQGFKTGLSLSPHLTDIRERFQINDRLISKERFCHVLDKMVPAVERIEKSDLGKPTYFEILVALAFYLFSLEKVDYAVIETGLGGWLDGTNVVNNPHKLSVISKIGHDHIKLLGSSLAKIALHKAKIMKPGNLALSIHQHWSAKKVLIQEAESQKVNLLFVEPKLNYSFKELSQKGTVFDFKLGNFQLDRVKLGLLGCHQMENASLALASVITLSLRDGFTISEFKLRESLARAKFAGRMDILEFNEKTLIIDGAHNVQKMQAFLKTLKEIYPNQKFTFLLAFKKDKDVSRMLNMIKPLANKVVFTTFFNQKVKQGYAALAMQEAQINEICAKVGLTGTFIPDSQEALTGILKETEPLVITGSLYLVGEVYDLLQK